MSDLQPVGGWSSPGPMNGTDALFWRLSSNPRTRAHVTWLWFLDRLPEWNVFLDGWQWASRKLPRLTHRVIDTPLHAGTPAWAPDPGFRLTRHVRQVRLPGPSGLRELLDLVEERNTADFAPSHPPWEATLVEGYEHDRAAVLLKWHHSVGDAVTIISAAQRLLPQSAGTCTGLAVPGAAPGTAAPRTVARPAPAPAHGAVEGARTVLRETARVLTAPPDVRRSAGQLGRAVAQLARSSMPSPLLGQRSAAMRCGIATVPLAELKAAAKAADASVTSACVATVLGAFHRYHEFHGVSRRSLPVLVPVSLRAPCETGAGNLVASVLIAGPVHDMPARARTADVHAAVTEARGTVYRNLFTALADISSCVPGVVHKWLAPVLMRSIDVVVTSVPGLSGSPHMADVQVVNAVPWAPRGGAAANISMASHAGTCAIGTNLDPAAVTDPDLFHHCLEQSIQETVASV